MEEKKEIKEISYEVYEKETDKFYRKAFGHYMIFLLVVALAFLIG